MKNKKTNVAQRVAQAVSDFQLEQTGHVPLSVTVVLGEGTLVVTLHGALTPAEKVLAQNPAGSAKLQEFHQQLFTHSDGSLRRKIKQISGIEVREAVAEVEPTTGTVVHALASEKLVKVFLMAHRITAETGNRNKGKKQL